MTDDPRLTALEANPLYWRGRAAVRNDFARELMRQSGSDAASDVVTAEYKQAAKYEQQAETLAGLIPGTWPHAVAAATRGDLRPLGEFEMDGPKGGRE